MVPTGTFSTTSAPSCPLRLEPSPWRPRSALYSGLKRKWTRVLWRSLDSMTTSPPLPPSPPEGPPRGTNFSRRKAMQPLPPSPALTRIVASSMNMKTSCQLSAVSFQLDQHPSVPIRQELLRRVTRCCLPFKHKKAPDRSRSRYAPAFRVLLKADG